MDEVVAERYRELLESGFKYAGSFENPTMFIDTKAEGIHICGKGESDYINIYLLVSKGVIDDIKYLCSCDPTANVVIEVLCQLIKGKTIAVAKALKKEQFYEAIGSKGGTVRRKVWGSIELLNRVFTRFEARSAESGK
jgi:NifU-like protein involved in Fe-S cluster formation